MTSRHEAHPLVSSMASRPKVRISRTNTSTTDMISGFDAQSIQTIDQLSTARASVTMLDKLWTQIDVLDDVKAMAQQVNERGTFLSDHFTSLLAQMKESQHRLLEVMAKHTERSEKHRETRRKEARETSDKGELNEELVKKDSEDTKRRMQEFFFSQKKDAGDAQQQEFDELNEYVGEVRQRMADVGEHMKQFDDEMKKLW